jgi:hypothetical protein
VIVTLAFGITPPDASLTAPEMPPSVCCANREELHSATTATMESSRESREEKIRMEYLKWRASKSKVFPIGFLICQKTLETRFRMFQKSKKQLRYTSRARFRSD